MMKLAISVLVAGAVVCSLPGVSHAQSWSAEGPASRHDSGYDRTYYPQPSSNYIVVPRYIYVPTYTNPQAPVATSPTTVPMNGEEQEEQAHRAKIQVRVPPNAELWFENSKTSQTGAVREFVTPHLDAGKTFTYNIRARWTDSDGKTVDQSKTVKVQAGRESMVVFNSGL